MSDALAPPLTRQLYDALKNMPCACTEARTWYKDADGKIVPDRTCGKCAAVAAYLAEFG